MNRWSWREWSGRLASLRGWQPHFVGSLHELELGVRAYGRPALVIVNLQAPLTAWELGQRLRGLEGDSPVVVLGPRGQRGRPAASARGAVAGAAGGGSRAHGGAGAGGEPPGAGRAAAGIRRRRGGATG